MRRVKPPTSPTNAALFQTVVDLCRATSEQQLETVFDGFTVTTPSGWTPTRTLDLTGTVTTAALANFIATLILDAKARGAQRKQANV